MRKILFLFLLLLELFFLTPPIFAAKPPSCIAFVRPYEGIAGETRFSIFGNVENFPGNADASIGIIDTKKIHPAQSLPLPLVLDPANNSGNFGPIELGSFHLPSTYIANIYYITTVRGTISHFLCSSNDFRVYSSSTPTKLQCDPPGRNPKDQSKCLDSRCTPTGKNQCLLNAIVAPSTIPTPTPTSPFPPCAKWVYFYDDPEDRCKNKDKSIIAKLDTNDYKNSCRLNDIVIPTGNPEYINPNFKTRKCVAIQTGVGEISTEPQGFVKRIFSFVLGIAGGIALILIMISGYKLMASQGNPEAITAARDQLISAIVGLLFIIFSFVILQVIGVDILKIPGFNP